ncbi:MAG: hypothetical protein HGA31_04330 [Candidatus Moranbacteria bacterium]|nr:hypothetical protein [Candidatus Moranbacteria bacterium]
MEDSRSNRNVGDLMPADYRRQAGILTVATQSYAQAESQMRKLDMLVDELAMLCSLDKNRDEAVVENRKKLHDGITLEREILRTTYYPFFSAANRIFSRMHGMLLPMNVVAEVKFEITSFQERLKLVDEQIIACDGRLERMVAEAGLLDVFLGHWLSRIDTYVQRDETVRAWVNRHAPDWSKDGLGTAETYAWIRTYVRDTEIADVMTLSYRNLILMLAESTMHDTHDILVFMCRSESDDPEIEETVEELIRTVTGTLDRVLECKELADGFADAKMFETLIGSRDIMLAAFDDYLQLA